MLNIQRVSFQIIHSKYGVIMRFFENKFPIYVAGGKRYSNSFQDSMPCEILVGL